ncbi:MAG: hypothetical protein RIQ66_704 [Pseudomonadota bacterium]|jgi:hypothetical protein
MPVARPTTLLQQTMGLMPQSKMSMRTRQVRQEVPIGYRSRQRKRQRLHQLALKHLMGKIFFLSHGSP